MKILKYIIFLILACSAKILAEQPAWELVSMNPPRGQVVLFDTANGNIYSMGGGKNLFFSSDNGDTWNWLDNNCTGIVAYNNVIYTLKEYNYSIGLYKSYDQGLTWTEIKGDWSNPMSLFSAFWLVRDTTKIYIGIINKDNNMDIFIIQNDDNNWKYCGTLMLNGNGISVLTVKNNIMLSYYSVSHRSTIYLSIDTGKNWKTIPFNFGSIYNIYYKSPFEYFVTTDNGIWQSTDTCKTWIKKYLDSSIVYSFYMDEERKNIIANLIYKGMVYSSDSGKTWNNVHDFDELVRNVKGLPTSIYADKENFFIGPHYLGIFRSTNHGKSWEEKNNGFSSINPLDFIITPNNELFISYFGVFKSDNNGKNFTIKGMRDYCFQSLAYNKKGYIFAGTGYYNMLGAYMYRSKDGGNTWDSVYVSQTDISGIVIDDKDNIFVGSAGSVVRSTDDGETWKFCPVPCGKIGINDKGHIFSFSTGHIFSSTDQGETWREIASQQVDPAYVERAGRVIFNKKTKTAAYGALITTNNGLSWFPTVASDCNLQTTESKSYAVDSLGCWISTNVWNSKKDNYDYGLFRSCDNGATWEKMDTTGLKHRQYGPIEVSPDGHIYVFGSTGGLYRSRDAYVSVPEQKTENNIRIQNYPNPVSEKTEIVVNLKQQGQLSLSVFDALGKLCETKSYGWQSPGETTILFDTDNYPSGVYFCRIECGVQREMKTINVLK